MGVIALLSTSSFSGNVTSSLLEDILDLLGIKHGWRFLDSLDFLVRKTAHVVIYSILALLWYRCLIRAAGMGRTKAIIVSLAISVVWAASDEVHQYFVPDRTAKVSDVMLDSAAAAAALVVIGPMMNVKKKSRQAAAQ